MNATGQTTVVQKTIAIIDDEPDNLTVLEDSLSRAGYRVEAFPRGELAIAGACEEPPDLVLLDIRMPGMDGYEVCRRFKADERLKTIPIIFISALSAVEDIATGFKCGGVDYVTKPFREPELLARVSSHLALRAAHLQVEEQHEKLLTLEKHRDTLVHMMVHDLRRPLTVIYGCLQIMELRSDRSLDETDLAILSDAVHGVERLSNMITTVIDLNRMENAEIPLNQLADCHAASGVQPSDAFLRVLSAMFDYVAVHFKAEEGYLKNIEFPGLSAHTKEHNAFVEAMADFNMAALDGKRDAVAVHQYLKEWLLNHILKSDMQYRRFAEGCDSGLPRLSPL